MNATRDDDEFAVVGSKDAHSGSEMKVQRVFAQNLFRGAGGDNHATRQQK